MPIRRDLWLKGFAACAVVGAVGFFLVTSPAVWSLFHPGLDVADAGQPDLKNGKEVFIASDCSTCHATPDKGDPNHLGGGRKLNTIFGLFLMPNISPDPKTGIGNWTLAQFDRAVRRGVGIHGENLYPAFPYTSYQRLTANDVRDLFAYIKTSTPVSKPTLAHDLKFPYNIRRGVGVWRLAFLNGRQLSPAKHVPAGVEPAVYARGRYLVEGPGHCAECHSKRTFMGNISAANRYGGGPAPDNLNYFPNISPDETGIGFWSTASIVNYLKSGKSPIGKIADGDMAEVIENTSQLSAKDLYAMAVYLKSVPPVDRPAPGTPEPNRTSEIVMLPQVIKKAIRMPTSTKSEIAAADTLYVTKTKNLFLSAAELDGKPAETDGKLLGAAELHILARDGDKLQLRLDGWQMIGAQSVIYRVEGKRIITAVLGGDAISAVKRGKARLNKETGQSWQPVSLTFWTDDTEMNTQISPLWDYTSGLFKQTCSVCHVLPHEDHFLANQWIGTLKSMKRFTSLTDDQYRLLLSYLQTNSKDMNDKGHDKP